MNGSAEEVGAEVVTAIISSLVGVAAGAGAAAVRPAKTVMRLMKRIFGGCSVVVVAFAVMIYGRVQSKRANDSEGRLPGIINTTKSIVIQESVTDQQVIYT